MSRRNKSRSDMRSDMRSDTHKSTAYAPSGPLTHAPTLSTIDGESIKPFKPTAEMLHNKSMVMYGPSESGKTFILKYFMYLLRNTIPSYIVYSLTARVNGNYNNIVAPFWVRSKLNLKQIGRLLEKQEASAERYIEVNNIENLVRLYLLMPSKKFDSQIKKIEEVRKIRIDKIHNDTQIPLDEKEDNIKEINKSADHLKIAKFRQYIFTHLDEFAAMRLSPKHQRMLKFLNINPDLFLIFDDCGSDLPPMLKKESFKQLSYQGRHLRSTITYNLQHAHELPNNIRNNVFINIFMTKTTATAFIENKTNMFSKEFKKYAARVADTVFDYHKYAVLVHMREKPEMESLLWFIAPFTPKFVVGSETIRELGFVLERETARVVNESSEFRALYA